MFNPVFDQLKIICSIFYAISRSFQRFDCTGDVGGPGVVVEKETGKAVCLHSIHIANWNSSCTMVEETVVDYFYRGLIQNRVYPSETERTPQNELTEYDLLI